MGGGAFSGGGIRRRVAAAALAVAAGVASGALLADAAVAQARGASRPAGALEARLPGGQRLPLYAGSHALVIGVAHYRRGWPVLPGVADDVRAVGRLLGEHGFGVTTVMDPTREQLDRALRQFVEAHGQQLGNRLLVYFAGHGHTQATAAGGRLGYIVPVDAPLPADNLAAFKSTAYSMENIEALARQIDAKHALFIFDSCFSGTIFRMRGKAPPENISEKTAHPVREFITSGDENQKVPDQSIFRRQLEAGLRGAADLNRDGYVTGSELGSFLEDTVTDYTRRAQTPRWGKMRDPNLDRGDIVFALGAQRMAAAPDVAPAARAVDLEPRLGGEAFYVPRLDVTVLADGNLPARLPLGIASIEPDGGLPRARAFEWIKALNERKHLGFDDWRLARVDPINGRSFEFNDGGNPVSWQNGSMDLGVNLSAAGTRFAGSTGSELPYLFYNVFRSKAARNLQGEAQDTSANDHAPLRNLSAERYWTSRAYGDGGGITFSFKDGAQFAHQASTASNPDGGFRFGVIVLRSGDVQAATNRP